MRSKLFLAFFAVSFFVACGKTKEEKAVTQSEVVGSEKIRGVVALYDSVHVRALRGDTLGLVTVLVSDSMYRHGVWPATPSYDPEREEVWNLVIGMHKANSTKGLRRMLLDLQQYHDELIETPDFKQEAVPAGILYHAPKRERERGGLRLFGSALCDSEEMCQVLSYNQGGMKGGPVENDTESEIQ
jgi:hypothetical protein